MSPTTSRIARHAGCIAICVSFLSHGLARAESSWTYVDLVNQMINLEQLSVLPGPGENCLQWSSYDRASKYDESKGEYIAWDANGDGGHFIRQEGDQFVMAEIDGPGCIWRIWSALAKEGHVKIYLDGGEEPAVDLPFREYFTGNTAPFNYPKLSYQLEDVGCRGHNLYFPIPFRKSCKVVADKDWGAYYHFTYTVYPPDTDLPTFDADLSDDAVAALKKVDSFFASELGADPAGARPGQETIADTIELAAGASQRLDLKGPHAITGIRGKVQLSDREDQISALRELLLKITFDDRDAPSVWCPLGDFFGTAPGENLYRSLPTGMTEDGYYAYWYMPFGKSASIELCNQGDTDRTIQFEIVHAPLNRPFEGMGHFHAKWHRDAFNVRPDRKPDWGILQTEGCGRFCGVTLHIWNARGGWWGEGDEKFFVDGEKFPSTFGTGSEDYFGYAWCHPGLFQYAYHCQTMTQNNRGHQSVLRWHVTDNIPFRTSFEAVIEKYYPNERGTLYACVPCFYLDPEHSDPIAPTPVGQRDGYYVKPPAGGGGFKVIGDPPGAVQDQPMGGWGAGKWNNDDQLWWTGAKPGDKMDVVLKVKESGTYDVIVKLTKAVDYGIVQLYVDGNMAGDPIDLFNDGVVPTGPIGIGTHQLKKGNHTLTVEIKGCNPEAAKGYLFGLDQVIFQPAGEK